MTIDELDQILNNCLNNAMIKSCRLKQPTNSNEIAKFVSEWLVKNNNILPIVINCPCCNGTDIMNGDDRHGEYFCKNCGEYF